MSGTFEPFVTTQDQLSLDRANSEGAIDPSETGIADDVIDLKQDLLEECHDDKESVASENVPQAESTPLIEAPFQSNLIEKKQALSEAGYSDHGGSADDASPKNVDQLA